MKVGVQQQIVPSACVLTVDVGNTSTRFGLFAQGGIGAAAQALKTWEVTTPARITPDEARMQLTQVLSVLAGSELHAGQLDARPVAGVLSCVVPSLEHAWNEALASVCIRRCYVVGPGLKTGVALSYDDPSEIGPDRIADAVAARVLFGAPCVVVDMGTTTNIEVIDAAGAFAGGIIAPGLALGARSLSVAAARLPMVDLHAPRRVIGRSTRDAMRSGIVLGEVARIDGMLDMVLAEMRQVGAAGEEQNVPVVITGDNAQAMAALLHHEVATEDTLTLRGLAELYRLNARASKHA